MDEDPYTLFDFDITLDKASIVTPVLAHEGDVLKGIYTSYGVPELGAFPHTKFELLLQVEQLVQIRAALMVLKVDVPQAVATLRRLQDEGKIVSMVYGGTYEETVEVPKG